MEMGAADHSRHSRMEHEKRIQPNWTELLKETSLHTDHIVRRPRFVYVVGNEMNLKSVVGRCEAWSDFDSFNIQTCAKSVVGATFASQLSTEKIFLNV